jgi:hypothetical protein
MVEGMLCAAACKLAELQKSGEDTNRNASAIFKIPFLPNQKRNLFRQTISKGSSEPF